MAMVPVTADMANGHGADDADLAGQPMPELLPPVAMTGIVQPRGPDGVELRCLACGQLFVAKRRDARTCTRRCAATLWPSRDRPRQRPTIRRCEDESCDTPITGGRSDRRFCSYQCRKRAHRRRLAAQSPQLADEQPVRLLPGGPGKPVP
jgi:hypothetical protein